MYFRTYGFLVEEGETGFDETKIRVQEELDSWNLWELRLKEREIGEPLFSGYRISVFQEEKETEISFQIR